MNHPVASTSRQQPAFLDGIPSADLDTFSDSKASSTPPPSPQFYVSGELQGTPDRIKELRAANELGAICPKALKPKERLGQMKKGADKGSCCDTV